MAAQQPVPNPRNCCCFVLLRKLLWDCCWGKRRFLFSPRCQCHWAVADWSNVSGPRWLLRGLSSVLQEWLDSVNVYKVLYLTAVIYPRVSGTTPALSCWYPLVLQPIHFWKELSRSVCKGLLLHFSVWNIHSLFSYRCCDVLLVCVYLRNIKLFQRIFFPPVNIFLASLRRKTNLV